MARKKRRGGKRCHCKTEKGKLKRGCEWRKGPNANWSTKGCNK